MAWSRVSAGPLHGSGMLLEAGQGPVGAPTTITRNPAPPKIGSFVIMPAVTTTRPENGQNIMDGAAGRT